MSLTDRYTDFGKTAFGVAPADAGPEAAEDAKLESFEKGYQAGWDDAVAAHTTEQARAAAEVSQTLQELSFTYQEAYSKLALSIKPLMTSLVTTLLPKIAHEAVGLQIMAELETLLDSQRDGAIEITVSPENAAQVEELLADKPAIPFKIATDPTLSAGQIYLRADHDERHIDLDGVLSTITDAVEAFFENAQKEVKHG